MKLQYFLGIWNVYQRFLYQFDKFSRPLKAILKKGIAPDWYLPSETQTKLFEALKFAFYEPQILSFPKLGKEYIIDRDSSF